MLKQVVRGLVLLAPLLALSACVQPATKKTYCIQVQDASGNWVNSGWTVEIDPTSGVKTATLTAPNGDAYTGSYTYNSSTGTFSIVGGSGAGGDSCGGNATTMPDGTINWDAFGPGWTGTPDNPTNNPLEGKCRLVEAPC
jgi:hypothetical protein